MDAEGRMEKALSKLKQDLTGIRTGRGNPGMVDSLRAKPTSPVPIKQIASVALLNRNNSSSALSIQAQSKTSKKASSRATSARPAKRRQGDPPQHPALSGEVRARWSPARRSWPKRPRSPSATFAATQQAGRSGRKSKSLTEDDLSPPGRSPRLPEEVRDNAMTWPKKPR